MPATFIHHVMDSLNDILKKHIEIKAGYFLDAGVKVELDLDPDMPQIYPGLDQRRGYPDYLRGMLLELTGEQMDARTWSNVTTKLRYSTLFVDGVQVIIIEHDGKPIPDDIITKLNRELAVIYETRETVNPGGRGGNKRAAVQISSYGGRIYIENHPDREYKVETTVELPVKPFSF